MQILWTKTARNNLEQAQAYIGKENSKAAIKTSLRTVKAVEILIAHPAAGHPGRVVGTRELVISSTPFIDPYRIKKHYIEILRVFHTAMQWPD